ncbi:MAG: DUF7706 family protein [Methylobacter sp.]
MRHCAIFSLLKNLYNSREEHDTPNCESTRTTNRSHRAIFKTRGFRDHAKTDDEAYNMQDAARAIEKELNAAGFNLR